MKQKHRRMTGRKKSNQFIVLHGEQASFCFELDYEKEELMEILQKVDFKQIKTRLDEEKKKSKKRGKDMKAKRNLDEILNSLLEEWY